jgi:hypothetical protein
MSFGYLGKRRYETRYDDMNPQDVEDNVHGNYEQQRDHFGPASPQSCLKSILGDMKEREKLQHPEREDSATTATSGGSSQWRNQKRLV